MASKSPQSKSDKAPEDTSTQTPQGDSGRPSVKDPSGTTGTGTLARRGRRQKCYNCGKFGTHIASECPEQKAGDTCYNCGKSGHVARNCPSELDLTKEECYNCHEKGHLAKNCTKPPNEENRCYNCDKTGHLARDCSAPKRPTTEECYNCGKKVM